MLYITEERETLKSLMLKEGYTGSFADYVSALSTANPHLGLKNAPPESVLPSFAPIILVTEPSSPDAKIAIGEINQFSLHERQILREMQEGGYDLLTQVVMHDIMEELQKYAAQFRKFYDDPLISTPWDAVNRGLTSSSLPDVLAELSIYGSQRLKGSRRMYMLDLLFENMMKRDDLNRRIMLLKGQRSPHAAKLKIDLEKQVQVLTAEIKKMLNERIDRKMTGYLSSFSSNEIRKLRMNSFSLKAVRKGQTVATRLDLLNRTGMKTLKKVVSGLRKIGNHSVKVSAVLGVAAVAYDVGEAYLNNKNVPRAFITGAAGVGTAAALTSMGSYTAFGSLAIAGLSGEAAAATCLLFTPAGVVVVTIAGIATVGYASYKASALVGEMWDEYGDAVCKKVTSVAHTVYEDIISAWKTSSRWLLNFYGEKG